jgi:hypothetical protein
MHYWRTHTSEHQRIAAQQGHRTHCTRNTAVSTCTLKCYL